MSQPTHSRLITAAARKHLRPIGMQQKGQSRLWFKDHGWWVAVVEFQPSNWNRGSYLNVAAMWLWTAKDYWSFDYHGRRGRFNTFQSEGQFAPAAEQIAEAARDEVLALERLFESPELALHRLSDDAGSGFWSAYHAFSLALATRKLDSATRHLNAIKAYAPEQDWLAAAQRRATQIIEDAMTADDPQTLVTEEVLKARQLLKLPPLEPSTIWAVT